MCFQLNNMLNISHHHYGCHLTEPNCATEQLGFLVLTYLFGEQGREVGGVVVM
jgi:hypothetical protein